MKQGFFYIISEDFFKKFTALGCKFKYNKNSSRPTYCCFEDIKHKGLFWAIPTSSIENKNIERINTYLSYDEKDIRSSYYHIGYTNRKALFCISSAFPITEKYIQREYTVSGIPLELKRVSTKKEIWNKLLKILTYENRFPNRLETHISTIKSVLIEELNK